MFSFDDPPEHTRKRGLVSAPFSAAATARLRPRIRSLVEEFLAPLEPGEVLDIDEALSARLPVVVTCEMLGIPDADRNRCVDWVERLTSSNQPVLTGTEASTIAAKADRAADEAAEYFLDLVHERAAHPRDDVLSQLAPLALSDGAFSPDEIVATLVLLMAAGFETTRYTITGGLQTLVEHPDQWQAAAADLVDGSLSDDAFEELLRHQGPIHGALGRRSAEAERFDDIDIPPGEAVVAMLAAANRDPAVFGDPDRLDVRRRGRRPLSFGAGPHYCLGAPLARDEIVLAVGGVLSRVGGLEILEPPVPKGSFNVRGPKGLLVRAL
jgi:cytochrome P450